MSKYVYRPPKQKRPLWDRVLTAGCFVLSMIGATAMIAIIILGWLHAAISHV